MSARKIPAELADAYGFDRRPTPNPADWRTGPGTFEGEALAAAYYYDAMMNCDGEPVYCGEECIADGFAVSAEDRTLLGAMIPDGADWAILHHSSQGFETLEFCTSAEWAAFADRFSEDGGES